MDDKKLARFWEERINAAGFHTIVVQDGHRALECAKKLIPDFVLLDIMLPRLNGLQVLKKLRSDNSMQGVKVAIFTDLPIAHGDFGTELADEIISREDDPDHVVSQVQALVADS
jgi:two-component system alkaline phosphatase synthesis response regulator PhoP